ncbi:MAG: hypothetical protein U5L96_15765 [Owenweeksia sp.]|nr:hypothetical protein [Owenweeksia sp.]
MRNQLYYWIYGRSTNFVVPGKNDQLFSWDYWSAYRGLNEVGADNMQHKINNLRAAAG